MKNNYELGQIGNMDETPMWFDMPNARTVNQCGAKTVLVKTTGHEKSRFTVVLTCMADGTKLKPMVMFKRKTMPKGNFAAGVVIHVHPNGWMDNDGREYRIRSVAISLIRLKKLMRHHKMDLSGFFRIPGGLTSRSTCI